MLVSLKLPGGWDQTLPRKNNRDGPAPTRHMAGQDQGANQSLCLLLCGRQSTDSQHLDVSVASQPKRSRLFRPLAAPDN